MDKKQLRVKYKELRANLSDETIDELSLDIANNLLDLPIWEQSFYHIFLSIQKQKEIDTEFILHILQGKDKNVILSKTDFKNITLEHILLTDTTKFAINSWGIPEPMDGILIPVDKIEVVFVPLLAYDLQGNRVGYGKGFYDSFLSECNSKTIKIGLSFFNPEDKIDNVSPTDISLDYCITPNEIHAFKKNITNQ